jgi:hypothetical protein
MLWRRKREAPPPAHEAQAKFIFAGPRNIFYLGFTSRPGYFNMGSGLLMRISN